MLLVRGTAQCVRGTVGGGQALGTGYGWGLGTGRGGYGVLGTSGCPVITSERFKIQRFGIILEFRIDSVAKITDFIYYDHNYNNNADP